jgi:hypothetical protein
MAGDGNDWLARQMRAKPSIMVVHNRSTADLIYVARQRDRGREFLDWDQFCLDS